MCRAHRAGPCCFCAARSGTPGRGQTAACTAICERAALAPRSVTPRFAAGIRACPPARQQRARLPAARRLLTCTWSAPAGRSYGVLEMPALSREALSSWRSRVLPEQSKALGPAQGSRLVPLPRRCPSLNPAHLKGRNDPWCTQSSPGLRPDGAGHAEPVNCVNGACAGPVMAPGQNSGKKSWPRIARLAARSPLQGMNVMRIETGMSRAVA